jgi:hypothetical protein
MSDSASDSAGEWLINLKRLQRTQQETEADVARKTQEHQATADAWASRVVRPAFATLQQHFNQSGGTRHLAVYPDMPEESPPPRQARGIEALSSSPGRRPPVSYSQVGVEVVRDGGREFAYYLLISADPEGVAVRKVVTDADAEQSAAHAGVKSARLPPEISPQSLTADNTELLINDFLEEYATFYKLSRP